MFLVGVVRDGQADDPARPLRASGFAVGAALSIGASLYAIARVSIALPVVWALLPSRVLGVLVMRSRWCWGADCG
ncbi:MAG TPA: hypothetical protein VFO16_09890 [Pseudonocardiaceae bacterium]|nr:hypothetical protein [Pseudonocardiaceae bacterium]